MWRIEVIENTLKINKKTALSLFKENKKLEDIGAEIWYRLSDITDDTGCITFNFDHYEHMDFFSNSPGIVKILKENKVKGRVLFGCLDGDQSGEFWGYSFDGNGKMTHLTGELVWKAAKKKNKENV